MRGTGLRLYAVGVALALLAFGCSRETPTSSAPRLGHGSGPAPLIAAPPGAESVPGSYIVVLKPMATANAQQAVAQAAAQFGVSPKYSYSDAVKGFAADLSQTQLESVRNDARVDYVEQDQIVHLSTTQTNPPSWGMDRVDQHPLPLDLSYTYNQTGTGVDAYIIDTGIRITHSDFGGRAVVGIDEVTPGGNAVDGNGHGTHVSGTVGGTTYGIAKSVHLIAVRVLGDNGSGSMSGVIAGVDWVTSNHTNHPAVANMSLGGSISPTLDSAVRSSIADGVVYCVAAGNSTMDASGQSPARVPEALTIAASSNSDGFASFSNYGSLIDLIAPGVSIKSDWNTSDTATNTLSGTSMATPHVTGAAALYLQANPTATPAQVASGLVAISTPGVIHGVPTGTVNKLLYTLIGSTPPPPPPGLQAPVLVAPPNDASGVSTSPTLSWNASSGATSYEAQLATDSAFTHMVSDQPGLTGTSATVTGLTAGTQYFWRVMARNANGTSPWSTVWNFTTTGGGGTPPAAPHLYYPYQGATGISRTPTLMWYASTGATSYRVQVSRASSFTNLVYDHAGLPTTSVTLPVVSGYTWYYWRVTASNANGTSSWSTVRYFRTRS